jgi:hypothetical protein
MRRTSRTSIRTRAAAMAVCVLGAWILTILCETHAASDSTAAKTAAKKTSIPATPAATFAVPPPPTNIFVSVFSTDNPRDPFHPQNKPKAAAATVLSGPQSEVEQSQVASAIQNGFQGIYGFGEDRELLVYGVLLRENREATVIVPVNGQPRKLKVKATKIYRNTAELQVEGVAQLITVPKTKS